MHDIYQFQLQHIVDCTLCSDEHVYTKTERGGGGSEKRRKIAREEDREWLTIIVIIVHTMGDDLIPNTMKRELKLKMSDNYFQFQNELPVDIFNGLLS